MSKKGLPPTNNHRPLAPLPVPLPACSTSTFLAGMALLRGLAEVTVWMKTICTNQQAPPPPQALRGILARGRAAQTPPLDSISPTNICVPSTAACRFLPHKPSCFSVTIVPSTPSSEARFGVDYRSQALTFHSRLPEEGRACARGIYVRPISVSGPAPRRNPSLLARQRLAQRLKNRHDARPIRLGSQRFASPDLAIAA